MEKIDQMSFSGADINVYVMVSPEALFKKISLPNQNNTAAQSVNTANQNPFFEEVPNYEFDPILNTILYGYDTGINPQQNNNSLSSPANPSFGINTNSAAMVDFNNSFKHLAELQTISYSIYRDKEQVKALGQPTPKGYTRGFVTIAGTMIFTVFKEAVLLELFKNGFVDDYFNGSRIDQLPPLDLFITFTNEKGDISKMAVFGVEFMNEGQVMSIQDLITENSVNYVARHITRMTNANGIVAQYGASIASLSRQSLPMFEIMKASKEIHDQRKYHL